MSEPSNPTLDARDVADAIASRRSTLPEYLGAQLEEGFAWSLPGRMVQDYRTGPGPIGPGVELTLAPRGVQPDPATLLDEDHWKASEWWREGLTWDPAMTPRRAQALAEIHDEGRFRRWLLEQRQAGIADTVLGFGAGMVGGLADPMNFIPFTGPAFRAAAAQRFGSIAGRAMVAATDAGLGTALVEPLVASSRLVAGDDVTFADALTDIAAGAAVGFAFGGAHGLVTRLREGWRSGTLPPLDVPTQEAVRRAVSEAASDLAAGRAIDVDTAAVLDARSAAARAAEQAAPAPARTPEEQAMARAQLLETPQLREMAAAEGGDPLLRQAAAAEIERRASLPPVSTAAHQQQARVGALPSLLELLSERGLRDDDGDLGAMNAELWHRGKPGRRRLVRDDGWSLDQAREMATEAGYLGGGDRDTSRTTVADLLEAIRRELAGERVYPPDSAEAHAAADAAAAAEDRRYMEAAAEAAGIEHRGLSDTALRNRLFDFEEAQARGEQGGEIPPERTVAPEDDIPFDVVFDETPDPARAAAAAEAAAEGPKPARTLDEQLRAAGVEPDDLAAVQAELKEIEGRLSPEQRAELAAAEEAAKALEATGDALERAAACPF